MIQVLNKTTDVMKFGKYKSRTVQQVIDENASYFTWCEEKGIVKLSEEIKDIVSSMADAQRRAYLDSLDNMDYPDDWGDKD